MVGSLESIKGKRKFILEKHSTVRRIHLHRNTDTVGLWECDSARVCWQSGQVAKWVRYIYTKKTLLQVKQ